MAALAERVRQRDIVVATKRLSSFLQSSSGDRSFCDLTIFFDFNSLQMVWFSLKTPGLYEGIQYTNSLSLQTHLFCELLSGPKSRRSCTSGANVRHFKRRRLHVGPYD